MPEIGDFFVVRTNGILARIVRWVTSSSVNHAGVYVGGGMVIEARPGGAGYKDVERYADALWSTGKLPAHLVPDNAQRLLIVNEAVRVIGTPYGMIDIVAIGLCQQRLGSFLKSWKSLSDQPWYIRRIMESNRLICSQLVDSVYDRSEIHFFTDGRPSGLVSPEDLRSLLTTDV